MAKQHYIFIDFENLQPSDITLLKNYSDVFVKIFVGSQQNKISFDFVASVQELNAQYIKINSTGHNALDFHIAYYIGLLSGVNIEISIVSKDKGFDPLVEHVKSKGIQINRASSIQEAVKYDKTIVSKAQVTHNLPKNNVTETAVKKANSSKPTINKPKVIKPNKASSSPTPDINRVVGFVKNLGNKNARPKKTKALHNALNTHFSNEINQKTFNKLLKEMVQKEIINVKGDKIDYL